MCPTWDCGIGQDWDLWESIGQSYVCPTWDCGIGQTHRIEHVEWDLWESIGQSYVCPTWDWDRTGLSM